VQSQVHCRSTIGSSACRAAAGHGLRRCRLNKAVTMNFEIIALDKARGGRVKKEAHLRGTPIPAPMAPFATLVARSTLAIPYAPKVAQGQGMASEPTHRSTNAQRPRLGGCDRSSLAEATEAAWRAGISAPIRMRAYLGRTPTFIREQFVNGVRHLGTTDRVHRSDREGDRPTNRPSAPLGVICRCRDCFVGGYA
jgi:hypothetical protein